MRHKAFNIAKNPKYNEYQKGVALMVYNVFDKKTSDEAIKSEKMSNKQLAEKLHKPVIRKFNKRKVRSSFIDNIWGADFAGMYLTSKLTAKNRVFLCVIHIFSKYAWVIPLKDKKEITVTNFFKKF